MKRGKRILAGILTAAMVMGGFTVPGLEGIGAGLLQAYAAENVALNKPVTVSALEIEAQWTGDMAVDGDKTDDDSRWSGGFMKGNHETSDQWLEIDLKAGETEVKSIEIAFHLKVWATKYQIQTRAGDSEEWETLHTIERAAADNDSVTDMFQSEEISGIASLKRYVRFYFTELNSVAGGDAVSVREITIMGTQTDVIDEVLSAQEALSRVPGSITVGADEDALPLPSVSGYDIQVYGSEVDCLVKEAEGEENGKLSPYRIGSRSFNVIVKAASETDPSDTAKKNVTVTAEGNTGKYPGLFPNVSNPNPMPDVLPTLQEWYGYEGNFVLADDTKIIVNAASNEELAEAAKEMQADLKEICGRTLAVEQGNSGSAGNIYLELLEEDIYGTGEEGYFLVNGDDGIKIYAHSKTGVLYGTVTVEQILYQDPARASVPKGVIRDYPLHGTRGVMFDVARIPTRMQFLQDYTKILKWYKLNEMQLHLNDTQWSFPQRNSGNAAQYDEVDASHRLESELFPSLAKQKTKYEHAGAFHTEEGDQAGDYEGRYDWYYNSYTGREGEELYYTKDEYRSLQDSAGEHGVKLIAELDTPGHATPYNKYVYNNQNEVITSLVNHGYLDRSEYLNADGSVKKNFFTHNPNNFEVFAIDDGNDNEAMRQNAVNSRIFIKALFDEYLGGVEGIDALFTRDTVHAGVDEYFNREEYNKSAFRRYMNEMYEHLGKTENGYQKEVRMWGGLKLMGGSDSVNRDIVLYMWNCRAEEDLNARLSDGFSMVNIPQQYLYTTPGRYHKDAPREEYLYYNWEPELFDGGGRVEKGEPQLKGVMAALWGDSNRSGTTEADLNERYLRLAAMVSEKTWGGTKEDDTFLAYGQTFERLREGPGTRIAHNVKSETNIVLDYDFENLSEDGGTIYDASGNGYHGTVTGGEAVEMDGETMLKFDGETKIETPVETLGYPYTVSFDLYLDGTEQNDKNSAIFSGYDGRLVAKLEAEGVAGNLGINRSFYTQSLGYRPVSKKKRRISIVGTHQTTKLYVDGAFQTILYARGRDADHGGQLGNEKWSDKDDNYSSTFIFPLKAIGENFSGYLGNIRAYDKALSTEEFAAEGSLTASADVARNRGAFADNHNSGFWGDTMRLFPAWKATDGDGRVTGAQGVSASYESRWNSSDYDGDFLMIDLGEERKISKVVIDWEPSRYAAAYHIQVSMDGQSWTTVKTVTGNAGDRTEDTFRATDARYVRMQGAARKSGSHEYAIYEMKVYEDVDKTGLNDLVGDLNAALRAEGIGWSAQGGDGKLRDLVILANAVCNDVMAGQKEVDEIKARLDQAFVPGAGDAASEEDANSKADTALEKLDEIVRKGNGSICAGDILPVEIDGVALKWSADSKHVTIDAQGGIIVADGLQEAADVTFTVEVSYGGFWSVKKPVTVKVSSARIEEKFTVTFYAGGGAPKPASQTVTSGGKAVKPANPSRTGYKFAGWYLGSKAYDFGKPVEGNITLTARWTINTYKITFYANGPGASGMPGTVTRNYNDTLNLSKVKAPVRNGYKFSGWSRTVNGPVLASLKITANLTLYAKWEALLQNGKIYIVSKMKYKALDSGKRTVAIAGSENKKATSLKIGDTVTINGISCVISQIGKNAFKGYKKLTKVTVGKNVELIGKNAFSGCGKLRTVTLKKGSVLKKAQSGAFKNTAKNLAIKVFGMKAAQKKKLQTAMRKGGNKNVKVK